MQKQFSIAFNISFFLFLFGIAIPSSYTQTPAENYYNSEIQPLKADQEALDKAVAEIDYEKYRKDQKSKEEQKKEQQEQQEFENNLGPFFKFLLITIAIGLLAFLLIKLMDAENIFSPKNRKITGSAAKIDLENIEENLHESDLEGFIRQALASGNFALAIRLYYLAILKELSLSNQIKWKKDKTNREYSREMSGKPLANDFREATLIFERVWYGTGDVTELDYQRIEPSLKSLLQKIEQQKLVPTN